MTCKDCIHEELCMDMFKKQYPSYANKNITVDDCEHFKNKADFVEVEKISPCEVCAYNPPSSLDGKPCGVCPAKKKGEIHNG